MTCAVAGLSAPGRALACPTWNAALNANPAAASESKAVSLSWSAASSGCSNSSGDTWWSGVDHYEVHRSGASTSPFTSAGYYNVANRVLSTRSTTASNVVHRSNAKFYYRVYACENATCSSRFYGDGHGAPEPTSNTGDVVVTDVERYELSGITTPGDLADVVVRDNEVGYEAQAPHAMYFPQDWGYGLSGKLALYWSHAGDESDPSQVFMMLHDYNGWPSASNRFNGSAYWDAETLVAEGSTDDGDDDFATDHAWTMLLRQNGDKWVDLMVQTQYANGGAGTYNDHIVQIAGNQYGDDFSLDCTTSCAYKIIEDAYQVPTRKPKTHSSPICF